MKAPYLPSFSDNWPFVAERAEAGVAPVAAKRKDCGPRSSFKESSTCRVPRSLMSPIAPEKSFQKSRNSAFQSISLFDT